MSKIEAHNDGDRPRNFAVDPIRSERVAAARQRLASGEYESPEVISTVVDRLLSSFSDD